MWKRVIDKTNHTLQTHVKQSTYDAFKALADKQGITIYKLLQQVVDEFIMKVRAL